MGSKTTGLYHTSGHRYRETIPLWVCTCLCPLSENRRFACHLYARTMCVFVCVCALVRVGVRVSGCVGVCLWVFWVYPSLRVQFLLLYDTFLLWSSNIIYLWCDTLLPNLFRPQGALLQTALLTLLNFREISS